MTYSSSSFTNQILSTSDVQLRKDCLAKSGENAVDSPMTNLKTIEAKIASIYNKEAEFVSQIRRLRESCPKGYELSELIYQLSDERTLVLSYNK